MARHRETRQDGLEDRVVKIRRCAAVVKGGRRFSFNALVVVGNGRGKVAYGYGKANEVPPAVEKATKDAQGRLQRQKTIMLRGDTIPHRVVGRQLAEAARGKGISKAAFDRGHYRYHGRVKALADAAREGGLQF